MDFRFVAHQARDTHIISGADDVMALLEESQITIGTIRGSRYVTPIKVQVSQHLLTDSDYPDIKLCLPCSIMYYHIIEVLDSSPCNFRCGLSKNA